MKPLTTRLCLPLLFYVIVCRADEIKPTANLPKPSPAQLAWQQMEIEMFVCLDPCTWQDREYDNHSTPLSAINPDKLDADQWCRAAKSFGAGQILLVAKHTGGFCWWQTATSDYGIKKHALQGQQGDMVREVSEACQRNGLRLGVYISPHDDKWGVPMPEGQPTRPSRWATTRSFANN